MKTKTIKVYVYATYNEKGKLLSYSGLPTDCNRINITVDRSNPNYKGVEYMWGLGVPHELRKFLINPNSF